MISKIGVKVFKDVKGEIKKEVTGKIIKRVGEKNESQSE